jgi:hypothetical protein
MTQAVLDLRVPFPKLLPNPKFTYVGIDPTVTYLSHLIGFVYVFTVSWRMFMLLFVSAV